MENLFKLKKDGKTVGYKIVRQDSDGTHTLMHKLPKRAAFIKILIVRPDSTIALNNINKHFITHDTAYPFVTKDKNGKDVFAEDRLSISFPNGETVVGKVVWDFLSWQIEGGGMLTNFKQEDIELIEEKEDEEHNP